MAFGNLGKVIAGQALEATKKNVIDAIAGPEPGKAAAAPERPQAPAMSVGTVILGELQAMQRGLKEDQELAVLYHTGEEMLRIRDIFVPHIGVLVLIGTDSAQNPARVVVPAEQAKLVFKTLRVAPGAAPIRVNVHAPKPSAA